MRTQARYNQGSGVRNKKTDIIWDEEASERLKNVPVFLRSMVKKGIEQYARTKGLSSITPEMMEEMRKRVSGGGMRPVTGGKK